MTHGGVDVFDVFDYHIYIYIYIYIYGPRSDKRDLMAIKVKSNIFTQKERQPYCEHLLKI